MITKSSVLESDNPDWTPRPAAYGSDTEGKIFNSPESSLWVMTLHA